LSAENETTANVDSQTRDGGRRRFGVSGDFDGFSADALK
jgi:hypothetical protein